MTNEAWKFQAHIFLNLRLGWQGSVPPPAVPSRSPRHYWEERWGSRGPPSPRMAQMRSGGSTEVGRPPGRGERGVRDGGDIYPR